MIVYYLNMFSVTGRRGGTDLWDHNLPEQPVHPQPDQVVQRPVAVSVQVADRADRGDAWRRRTEPDRPSGDLLQVWSLSSFRVIRHLSTNYLN